MLACNQVAPRFACLAHVVLGHVGVELRRARICMPECSVHDVERVAVLHHVCAADVPQPDARWSAADRRRRAAWPHHQDGVCAEPEAHQATGDSRIDALTCATVPWTATHCVS